MLSMILDEVGLLLLLNESIISIAVVCSAAPSVPSSVPLRLCGSTDLFYLGYSAPLPYLRYNILKATQPIRGQHKIIFGLGGDQQLLPRNAYLSPWKKLLLVRHLTMSPYSIYTLDSA